MSVLVRDLRKTYRRTRALDGISFEVQTGEIFALLGPNGAGKTTTVEIVEGLRKPDSGEVKVFGLDPSKDRHRIRPIMGAMLEEPGIYPGIRVREAVRLFASYYANPLEPDSLIEQVGLGSHRKHSVRSLSNGQRQRLSLALAIVGRPEILFLDEPTAGMDPRGRVETWDLIRQLQGRGATVLLTTHQLDEAEKLADRVAIIDRGKLVALGSPTQLKSGMSRILIRTDHPIDIESLTDLIGGTIFPTSSNSYEIRSNPSAALIRQIAAFLESRKILLLGLETGAQSLEEVFLRMTSESPRDAG